MTLTIAYMTCRRDPRIQWFFDSLERETGGNYNGIKVVVVDFFEAQRSFGLRESLDVKMLGTGEDKRIEAGGGECFHVSPKPTVWAGEHALTKQDYFAASNARNTALCLAPDGWIAFVDDVSVLIHGWLNAVREAMAGKYIVCGAYRKVNKLNVVDGQVVSFEDHPAGHDGRWWKGSDTVAVDCTMYPEWTYGCSLAAPVDALLNIGGYPEICDGMGYEDCPVGFMLANNAYAPAKGLRYDRRMFTLESEEDHYQEPRFIREDPLRAGADPHANPRDDMSNAMLGILKKAKSHPGFFGEGGIRGLRQQVLAGEPFPITGIPEHRWFDNKPLVDLPEGAERKGRGHGPFVGHEPRS